jgi:hypothetical protein
MLRFRQVKSIQKTASVHANVHNHFKQERHLVGRQTYEGPPPWLSGRISWPEDCVIWGGPRRPETSCD